MNHDVDFEFCSIGEGTLSEVVVEMGTMFWMRVGLVDLRLLLFHVCTVIEASLLRRTFSSSLSSGKLTDHILTVRMYRNTNTNIDINTQAKAEHKQITTIKIRCA